MSTNTYAPVGLAASSAQAASSVHTVASPTRLRLTRRGRAVIAVLVTLPLAIALAAMVLNGGGATATPGDAVVPTVTVEAGESLWSVAAALAPQSSTADVVADLIAANELVSADLLPGQVLIVPERYAD